MLEYSVNEELFGDELMMASRPDGLFAHASIEVGHLGPRNFTRGTTHLQHRLNPIGPWINYAKNALSGNRPNAPISTCFMIDDYTESIRSPSEVFPRLLEASRRCNIEIDYIVRESALTDDPHSIASLVVDCLPKSKLVIRQRSDPQVASTTLADDDAKFSLEEEAAEELSGAQMSMPQSIYLSTELWTDSTSGKKWSCAFLAAVWQLARLGLLDDKSQAYLAPHAMDQFQNLSQWQNVPPVIQVSDKAAPFRAYKTLSILGSHYISVEAAVRTILRQAAVPPEIFERVTTSSDREGIIIPEKIVDRINYIFIGA